MINCEKPIIGVTMGDPAGIGSEITLKTFLKTEIFEVCKPIVIGDLKILENTARSLNLKVSIRRIQSVSEIHGGIGIVDIIDLGNIDLSSFEARKASAQGGKASLEYIRKAVSLALQGDIDAVATCPINKQAVRMAGSPYIGHTEILGALCGVKDPLTMFWVRGVKIFFLTRHIPLVEAIKAVKKKRIVDTVTRIVSEMRRIGFEDPLIAVASLNPHASDGGLIGDEEEKEIIPAVEELKSRGFRVTGPVPADSVFHNAFEGKYDAILSLYHDQGHIAAKTIDFYGTVSVTLGLPFIRTSVDHGTAYDIVGKGIANSKSLEEAIKLAAYLCGKTRLLKEETR